MATEEAALFRLFGAPVYAYGLALLLGCWAGLATLFCLGRKQEGESKAAAVAGVLALPLGLALARAAFVLLDPGFAPFLNLKNALDLTGGGFAMYGALLGIILAALASARAGKVRPARMLDLAAASAMAFLVPARLGEGFTALGISRPLTTQWLADSFLAYRDQYDAYLRTYLLEAAFALLTLVILLSYLRRAHKAGRVFTLGCLLYGVSQTLMESLRYDGHLRYSFIGVQQVLSAALFTGALAALAVSLLKTGKARALPTLSLAALPLIWAAAVGVEFLVDRSSLGKLPSYGLYLLVLAVPLALGVSMLRQEGRLAKGTD